MPVDDSRGDRNSTLAITSLTVSLFIGTQVLARLSTGSPGVGESLTAALLATMLIVTLGVGSAGRTAGAEAPRGGWRARMVHHRKPLLISGSLLFALVPRIELGGYAYIGLGLRMGLGLLVALVIGGQANRWLLGMSMLTIVLHRWNHPQPVTVTFVGLLLVAFALCTRSEMLNGQARSSQPEGTATGIRSVAGVRYPALIAVAIGLSLLGGVLLSDQARQLAWKPSGQNGLNGLGSADRGGSPQQRFNALKAQDQLDLSYRPTRSTQEIMTLYTDEATPVFLRAQTFDRWTGETWNNGRTVPFDERVQIGSWLVRPAFQATLVDYMRGRTDPLSPYTPLAPGVTAERMVIEAKVRFNGYTPSPVEPVAIITDIDAPTARWRADGTVTPDGKEGPSLYVVLHELEAPYAIDLSRTDLLDTSRVSDRTKALATEITRGAVDADTKAAAISRWVTANLKYNLDATPPAAGADQLDHILFESHEGSCTQFATVTAALLRAAGIPARIATGFVGQTQLLPKQIQVQAKDAHAWAEVPQADGHWKIFDTTLGSVEVLPSSSQTAWMWWIPLLVAAVGVAALVGYRQRRTRRRGRTPNQALWDELTGIGHLIGLYPAAPVSYRRFTAQLDATLAMDGGLSALGAGLDRSAFGPSEPGTVGGTDVSGTSDIIDLATTRATELAKRRKAADRQARRADSAFKRRLQRWINRLRGNHLPDRP